jgi:alkylhydroperoxidase family enzyme
MTRLPLNKEAWEHPAVATVLSRFHREGREPIALYYLLAHTPDLVQPFSDYGQALRNQATTSRELRELVVLRIAHLTACEYEWAHHVPMAVASGLPLSTIDGLHRWEASSAFGERERAVLRFVDQMHELAVSDVTFDDLHTYLDDAQIIEIALTVGHYEGVARVLQALDVDIEQAYEPHRGVPPLQPSQGHPPRRSTAPASSTTSAASSTTGPGSSSVTETPPTP